MGAIDRRADAELIAAAAHSSTPYLYLVRVPKQMMGVIRYVIEEMGPYRTLIHDCTYPGDGEGEGEGERESTEEERAKVQGKKLYLSLSTAAHSALSCLVSDPPLLCIPAYSAVVLAATCTIQVMGLLFIVIHSGYYIVCSLPLSPHAAWRGVRTRVAARRDMWERLCTERVGVARGRAKRLQEGEGEVYPGLGYHILRSRCACVIQRAFRRHLAMCRAVTLLSIQNTVKRVQRRPVLFIKRELFFHLLKASEDVTSPLPDPRFPRFGPEHDVGFSVLSRGAATTTLRGGDTILPAHSEYNAGTKVVMWPRATRQALDKACVQSGRQNIVPTCGVDAANVYITSIPKDTLPSVDCGSLPLVGTSPGLTYEHGYPYRTSSVMGDWLNPSLDDVDDDDGYDNVGGIPDAVIDETDSEEGEGEGEASPAPQRPRGMTRSDTLYNMTPEVARDISLAPRNPKHMLMLMSHKTVIRRITTEDFPLWAGGILKDNKLLDTYYAVEFDTWVEAIHRAALLVLSTRDSSRWLRRGQGIGNGMRALHFYAQQADPEIATDTEILRVCASLVLQRHIRGFLARAFARRIFLYNLPFTRDRSRPATSLPQPLSVKHDHQRIAIDKRGRGGPQRLPALPPHLRPLSRDGEGEEGDDTRQDSVVSVTPEEGAAVRLNTRLQGVQQRHAVQRGLSTGSGTGNPKRMSKRDQAELEARGTYQAILVTKGTQREKSMPHRDITLSMPSLKGTQPLAKQMGMNLGKSPSASIMDTMTDPDVAERLKNRHRSPTPYAGDPFEMDIDIDTPLEPRRTPSSPGARTPRTPRTPRSRADTAMSRDTPSRAHPSLDMSMDQGESVVGDDLYPGLIGGQDGAADIDLTETLRVTEGATRDRYDSRRHEIDMHIKKQADVVQTDAAAVRVGVRQHLKEEGKVLQARSRALRALTAPQRQQAVPIFDNRGYLVAYARTTNRGANAASVLRSLKQASFKGAKKTVVPDTSAMSGRLSGIRRAQVLRSLDSGLSFYPPPTAGEGENGGTVWSRPQTGDRDRDSTFLTTNGQGMSERERQKQLECEREIEQITASVPRVGAQEGEGEGEGGLRVDGTRSTSPTYARVHRDHVVTSAPPQNSPQRRLSNGYEGRYTPDRPYPGEDEASELSWRDDEGVDVRDGARVTESMPSYYDSTDEGRDSRVSGAYSLSSRQGARGMALGATLPPPQIESGLLPVFSTRQVNTAVVSGYPTPLSAPSVSSPRVSRGQPKTDLMTRTRRLREQRSQASSALEAEGQAKRERVHRTAAALDTKHWWQERQREKLHYAVDDAVQRRAAAIREMCHPRREAQSGLARGSVASLSTATSGRTSVHSETEANGEGERSTSSHVPQIEVIEWRRQSLGLGGTRKVVPKGEDSSVVRRYLEAKRRARDVGADMGRSLTSYGKAVAKQDTRLRGRAVTAERTARRQNESTAVSSNAASFYGNTIHKWL
ncbi:hypothetical protein KIPB_003846 [Kipferlia bialata]|uniref:Uncharacterized protein n=1 Tax=Kipferlia bialata TaxID=797122 RepID=A0A9K3CUJ7_9EUKA|nr:hypothetical protein KIPB_003846 [Kipferlia bialata]|eukprot:g3846.t1